MNHRQSTHGVPWLILLAGMLACDDANDEPSADETRAVAISMCEAFADCTGTEVEDCLKGADDRIEQGQTHGCLAVVKTWFDCLEANTVCEADAGSTDHDACHDQEELGEDCVKGRL
jgi:hypothetical protein